MVHVENLTIPESVIAIGEGAFRSCESLASITIRESVTTIGEGAFDACPSLRLDDRRAFDDTLPMKRRKV